jgi:hypothetical protein
MEMTDAIKEKLERWKRKYDQVNDPNPENYLCKDCQEGLMDCDCIEEWGTEILLLLLEQQNKTV